MTHHDDDEIKFSWTELFFVTGVSFLGFYYFLYWLDNYSISLFLWVGITMLVTGSIRGFWSMIKPVKKTIAKR